MGKNGSEITKPNIVRRTYRERKELHIFSLFWNFSFLDATMKQTNENIFLCGKMKEIRKEDIFAAFGFYVMTATERVFRDDNGGKVAPEVM